VVIRKGILKKQMNVKESKRIKGQGEGWKMVRIQE